MPSVAGTRQRQNRAGLAVGSGRLPARTAAAAAAPPAPLRAARGGAPADWLTRIRQPDMKLFARWWLTIFGGSLALFLARFLLPSAVGMADNGDGPRLLCAFGVGPVTGSYPRYDAFAYFTFA